MKPHEVQHPIERQMRQRLHYETARAKEIRERMEVLAPAYNEFLDLRAEFDSRRARAGILLGMIGDDVHAEVNVPRSEDGAAHLTGSSPQVLRSELPLWEAMKEYLQYVPEARIGEMEEFFDHIGYAEGNRQAIESALKRHPKEFRIIRRKKREKFIGRRTNTKPGASKKSVSPSRRSRPPTSSQLALLHYIEGRLDEATRVADAEAISRLRLPPPSRALPSPHLRRPPPRRPQNRV